jgi:hypothetical protein
MASQPLLKITQNLCYYSKLRAAKFKAIHQENHVNIYSVGYYVTKTFRQENPL